MNNIIKAPFFQSHSIRQALSVGMTIFIAVIVNVYFSFTHECWLVMAAYICGQTTLGTPVRQGLLYFVLMQAALVLAAALNYAPEILHLPTAFIVIAFVGSAGVLGLKREKNYHKIIMLILFFMMLMFAGLLPAGSASNLMNRMFDVTIGSGIGILAAQMIFPVRQVKEFRQGLESLLQAIHDDVEEITHSFLAQNESRGIDLVLERELESGTSAYPAWVYEVGFNRGLRGSFRFFLIKIEQVIEIIYSMNYLASRKVQAELLLDLKDPISVVAQKNALLLKIIREYFLNDRLGDIQDDFTTDMKDLESQLQKTIPTHLELLDLSPEYLVLTAFVRDLKDMRELLLQLVMSLPNK